MAITRRTFLKGAGGAFASLLAGPSLTFGGNEKIPVLLYHDISHRYRDPYTISPSLFAAHMEWLYGNGYRALSLRDADNDTGGKRVILTFDDGYESFLEYAYPLLTEYGFTAIVNIIGEKVGNYIDYGGNRPTMSWDEYRYLLEEERVEMGSHTFSLHRWNRTATGVSNKEVYDDLLRFQRTMRRETGHIASVLSWPYGKHDRRTRAVAKKAGFSRLFTSKRGYYTPGVEMDNIPRFTINGDTSLPLLEKIVEGRE